MHTEKFDSTKPAYEAPELSTLGTLAESIQGSGPATNADGELFNS